MYKEDMEKITKVTNSLLNNLSPEEKELATILQQDFINSVIPLYIFLKQIKMADDGLYIKYKAILAGVITSILSNSVKDVDEGLEVLRIVKEELYEFDKIVNK